MDQPGMPKKDRVFPTIIAMLIFSAAYWAIALHTNVYGIAAAGAIFEILWIRPRFAPLSFLFLLSCFS
jgi:hypothetical protein